MEKNRSVSTLHIVGGHPGLDLANTVDSRRNQGGPDVLAAYGDLLEWAERVGLLGAEAAAKLRRCADVAPGEAEAALARTKRLREAIYRVFSALAAGGEPPASDLGLIEDQARRALTSRRLVRTEAGYGWVWPEEEFDTLARRLAHEATELLTAPRLGRVKECSGRGCGWLFLDTSRNGLRRWCSEEDCGTPARVARHRSKMHPGTPNQG
jgi:predicted RNA-binding Zn ribbon-like protein